MFFFLPILFLLLCSVSIRRYLENWRASLLAASIITATALTVMTEGLSLFQWLSFYPVLICWSFLILGALKIVAREVRGTAWPRIDLRSWCLSEKVLLGAVVFICTITAITACSASPNTWDSMTYHLSRVQHWIQDRTIAFYPTNIIRQLYITPWTEFAIAHVRILGGGQSSPNFVQWSAMLGCLSGVSLIAGQLGATRKGQLMAATLAACLPMGILESVSTQTDYVCAFWLIVFAYFIIEAQRRSNFINLMAAGFSLGLAFLTKGNSYIFAAPFLICFMASHLKQRSLGNIKGLVLMFMCAASLNMGQYIRNIQTFGSPTWTSTPLTNGAFDWKVLEGNILRNMSIHLSTPSINTNNQLTRMVTGIAQFSGVDINDPRATFSQDFNINSIWLDEDYAGNFLHAFLFVGIFILVWLVPATNGMIRAYALSVLGSFLLFCLFLRFQPWNSRFHLPLFILFCPVAGLVLERFLRRWVALLGLVFFLGAMPWVFLNDQHPWFGNLSFWKQPKPVQYFYKHPYAAYPYAAVAGYLRSIDCRQVGLLTGEDSWEYPWWVLLAGQGLRIEHVDVKNQSSSLKYPLGDFQPCAVIVSEVAPPPFILSGNGVYGPAGVVPSGNGKITIYLRSNKENISYSR